jgi:hypothetical protein
VRRNGRERRLPGPTSESADLQMEIRDRAYELFLRRRATGGRGDALSDWLTGEAQVLEWRTLRLQQARRRAV